MQLISARDGSTSTNLTEFPRPNLKNYSKNLRREPLRHIRTPYDEATSYDYRWTQHQYAIDYTEEKTKKQAEKWLFFIFHSQLGKSVMYNSIKILDGCLFLEQCKMTNILPIHLKKRRYRQKYTTTDGKCAIECWCPLCVEQSIVGSPNTSGK